MILYVLSRHKPWYGFYFSVKLRAVVVWTRCSYLASPPLSTKDTLIMMIKFADRYQATANMCSYVVCRQNRVFPFACGWGFIPTAEGSIYNCLLQLRSSWWCSPRVKSHICNWLKASGCSDSCLFPPLSFLIQALGKQSGLFALALNCVLPFLEELPCNSRL